MSSSQKKKAEKARRRALREKARQEERRRNIMTGIITGIVVLLGAVLVFLSLDNDDDVDLEAIRREVEASASALAAAGSEAPTEVTPDDPDAEAGVAVDSGQDAQVDDRPVACDADEPANAGETRPQFPGGPAEVLQEGVDYRAVVTTSCGTVTLDLLEDATPATVNSFVFLAQQGFFDGLEIFRNATSIGALQTGGGNQTNGWQIGYGLPDELAVAETDGYPVGSVAMANAGANTGGSQFFFVYNNGFQQGVEQGGLGRTFTNFATVTEGLDVVQQIGEIPVEGETPNERVYMESVTIEES